MRSARPPLPARSRSGDCDLSDPSAIHELTDEIVSGSPNGISVIVHSAGSYLHGDVAATDVASLRREFVENVESVYLLTQSLLPALTPASTIVFMNSSQGVQTSSGNSQFGASMHALRGVADALREEVNGRGIRVTSIFLGRTATPRQENIYANNGWDYRPELLLQPEDVAEFVTQVVQAVPSAEVTEISMRPAMKSYDRRSGTDRRSPR